MLLFCLCIFSNFFFFNPLFSSLEYGHVALYKTNETETETMIPTTILAALVPVEIKEKRPERGTATAYFTCP